MVVKWNRGFKSNNAAVVDLIWEKKSVTLVETSGKHPPMNFCSISCHRQTKHSHGGHISHDSFFSFFLFRKVQIFCATRHHHTCRNAKWRFSSQDTVRSILLGNERKSVTLPLEPFGKHVSSLATLAMTAIMNFL